MYYGPAVPTVISHGILAAAGTRAALGARARRPLVIAAVIGSMVPDLDVISFALGIPYEHWLGHRGFSHSLVFAVLFGAAAAAWLARHEGGSRSTDFLVVTLATASHGLADALTNGGEGVGFFTPFDHHRYFFPWQPVEVSPIGLHFFTGGEGMNVILSELAILVLPSLAVLGAAETWRRRRS